MKFRLFLFILLVSTVGNLHAKVIEPDTLISKIIEKSRHVYQFDLQVAVKVFNPEAFVPLEEVVEDDKITFEDKEKGFLQHIIFMRDEYIFIETMDFENKPLHLYLQEGFKKGSVNIQDQRYFHFEDVFFSYVVLFTKFNRFLTWGLAGLGISPIETNIVKHGNIYAYQLGTSENNIIVDQDKFLVIEMNRIINIRGRDYPLKITFNRWDQKKKRIPRLVKFFIKSRLFKELKVNKIIYRGIRTSAETFSNKYKYYFPTLKFSETINFSQ
jgi:hypothetical protein